MLDRAGRVSSLRVNWASPFREQHEFKTGIIGHHDGTEQREALRQRPRRKYTFDVLLEPDRFRRFTADMMESMASAWAVPLRWEAVETTSAISGARTFDVSSAPWWIAPEATLVLSDGEIEEGVKVESVAGSTVTVAADIGTSFPSGSKVTRATAARLSSAQTLQAVTGKVWTGQVTFDGIPGTEDMVPGDVAETFEGREVFLRKPNWRDGIELSFEEVRWELDPGIGTNYWETPTGRTNLIERMGYTCRSSTLADELIAFYHRMRGQRGSFWMPTWQRELVPIQSYSAGADQVAFEGPDMAYGHAGSDVFNVLFALWPDGSWQINRLAHAEEIGGGAVFDFADPWDNPISPSSYFCFCPRWRFASDTLEVVWSTGEVAEMTLPMMTRPSTEGD